MILFIKYYYYIIKFQKTTYLIKIYYSKVLNIIYHNALNFIKLYNQKIKGKNEILNNFFLFTFIILRNKNYKNCKRNNSLNVYFLNQ